MQRTRPPAADPYRKARFREAAREIVARDRQDRKDGLAVDTAGAIARAMQRAYRQGFEDAQGKPRPAAAVHGPGEAMEWALIPPRPRAAFWSICLFALGRKEEAEQETYLVAITTERGTAGWQLILPGRPGYEKSIGGKTIIPLIRMGLLEMAPETSGRLLLSARGRATWWRFIEQGGQFPEDLTAI